jgi:hypothetical protein
MANLYDPQWDRVVRTIQTHYGMYDKIRVLELEKENKRLKKLAHDLQKEIEMKVLESQETHELEEK